MVVEYSIIERSQRDVMRYKSEPVAQVDFKHFYNPVEFWQDNVNLIQEDNKLRKENSEFSSNFGIPTTG
ncbi:hypothetical protein KAT36_04090 [Candidatus Pacearchaeota archaeon]|nr:hypothetical protein [Candidatus Pacearchaeota archaeon]